MAKENGNGSKWTMLVVRWGLGLGTAIIIVLASFGFNAITSKLDDQAGKIDKLAVKIEGLKEKIDSAILGDSLQGRDIREVKADLNDHIERHRP